MQQNGGKGDGMTGGCLTHGDETRGDRAAGNADRPLVLFFVKDNLCLARTCLAILEMRDRRDLYETSRVYNSTFRLHGEKLHLDHVTSAPAATCCSDRISTGSYLFFCIFSQNNLFRVYIHTKSLYMYIIFYEYISDKKNLV